MSKVYIIIIERIYNFRMTDCLIQGVFSSFEKADAVLIKLYEKYLNEIGNNVKESWLEWPDTEKCFELSNGGREIWGYIQVHELDDDDLI